MQGKCADKESKIKKETPGMNFLSAQEYGLFDLARMTHEFCFICGSEVTKAAGVVLLRRQQGCCK